MGFATFYFWICFGGLFLAYWKFLNRGDRLWPRNLVLLLTSYLFYASFDWRFLGIILVSTTVDFAIAKRIDRERSERWRRKLMMLSVVMNLGFLSIFKYHNFFIDSANQLFHLLGIEFLAGRLDWALPVGISFYTFQSISYTIDVYRREIAAEQNAINFYTYIAFFPQLLAGPIEKASNLLPQFRSVRMFNIHQTKNALLRILWGIFKKVVIADRLAVFVNSAYANPDDLNAYSFAVVVCAFTFQLYCDFSGYCDMAIGMAKLLGFDLSENFKRPLLAKNIRDVYQRWHITIHAWFRDYLYLQLSPKTKYLNVLLVFAIAGLWHGAGLNFLIWGCINGLFVLLVDPVLNFIGKSQIRLFTIWSKLMGHAIVYLSLVFFRSPSFEEAIHMLGLFYNWPRVADFDLFVHFSQFGLGAYELIFGFAFMAVVLAVEWIQEHRPEFSLSFFNGQGLHRWTVAFSLSMAIVLCGFYDHRKGNGEHIDQGANAEFLYEQF